MITFNALKIMASALDLDLRDISEFGRPSSEYAFASAISYHAAIEYNTKEPNQMTNTKLTKQQLQNKLQQIAMLALELEQGLDAAIETSDSGVINELYLEVASIVEATARAAKYNERVQSTYKDNLTKRNSK